MAQDKISKNDIKNPDLVTQELRKGFEWTTQHVQLVIGVIVLLLVVGSGWTAYNWMNDKKENELQAQYYQFEKQILKKKEAFEKFDQQAKVLPPKGAKKDETLNQGEKSSGDLDKDFGSSISDMLKIVNQAPSSKAAALSALVLSDLYLQYNKPSEGLAVLQKVKTKSSTLGALATHLEAGLLANNNDCAKAVTVWEEILKSKDAGFIHNEVRIRQGLCFENLNQADKASANYNKVVADAKDTQAAKTAEKYLRLLKVKTN
jgi:predicted negative regulator of RcsB-dependent stress response